MAERRKRGRKSLVLVNAAFMTGLLGLGTYVVFAMTFTYGLLPVSVGLPITAVFGLATAAAATTAVISIIPTMGGQGGS